MQNGFATLVNPGTKVSEIPAALPLDHPRRRTTDVHRRVNELLQKGASAEALRVLDEHEAELRLAE